MEKKSLMITLSAFTFLIFITFYGCDTFIPEVPPENLPPVPDKCITLSNKHMNALIIAYKSVEVSQLQVTKVANEFAQCMQDAGLSRGEAKGILKKNEAAAVEEAEKSSANDVHVFQ
ncbi:MAG: hypothetical protein A2X59_02345 [Nitrospirae bacterium GWC2_42_7]|nr:MAG: hypothetical protein A2X59_02345 [Nitrospirae bacterium GWC2_42_7]